MSQLQRKNKLNKGKSIYRVWPTGRGKISTHGEKGMKDIFNMVRSDDPCEDVKEDSHATSTDVPCACFDSVLYMHAWMYP